MPFTCHKWIKSRAKRRWIARRVPIHGIKIKKKNIFFSQKKIGPRFFLYFRLGYNSIEVNKKDSFDLHLQTKCEIQMRWCAITLNSVKFKYISIVDSNNNNKKSKCLTIKLEKHRWFAFNNIRTDNLAIEYWLNEFFSYFFPRVSIVSLLFDKSRQCWENANDIHIIDLQRSHISHILHCGIRWYIHKTSKHTHTHTNPFSNIFSL